MFVDPYSAGINFRRQILTSKVGPRADRIKIFLIAIDPYSLVPNRRSFGIKALVGKNLFFLLIEPVHNKSTSWEKKSHHDMSRYLDIILFCAFCIIQVFVYMYLILGPHSRREFLLSLTLLWATIFAQIHQAQPALGNSAKS